MATSRDQIEHLEHEWEKETYKHFSRSRRWLKRQMNRFMRRMIILDINKIENLIRDGNIN